ncbi:MAG TPA: hypothetical protein VKA08_11515 [Balneolales bacterium]|nr:hypothetical protein [Balneolales bacterium]
MNTARKLYQEDEFGTQALTAVEATDEAFLEEQVDEDQRLNEIYEALGWGDLPYKLKFVIASDVVGYYDELMGLYSTCDPGVIARRKRVAYWVENYRNHIASLETTLDALRIYR